MAAPFLPRTRAEMAQLGWDALDVLIVTGDAYVDHYSFGAAAIARYLESKGYRVGILDVPELEPDGSGWERLPTPKLWVGVTAGTIDSMVTNYTAAKRKRRTDVYRPGGLPGRPNRATIAYTAGARQHFKGVPVVVGGMEAGPRRLAYYDFWDDKIRRSILVDCKADLLVWGMGERTSLEITRRCEKGESLHGLAQSCEIASACPADARVVPSYEELVADNKLFVPLFQAVREENRPSGRVIAQAHGNRWVLQYPPVPPAAPDEVDEYYDLPFQRAWHPDHEAAGGVPALEPVKFSVNTHRGCFADCSFCSITFHQGRAIQGRSEASILKEAAKLGERFDFKGTITDVGGPTANMWGLGCKLLEKGEACLDRDCLTPDPCPALRLDKASEGYRRLLGLVKNTSGVKNAFVSSGVRYDMLKNKKGETLPLHDTLVKDHVPGRMKLAPEHASPEVLRLMNKPGFEKYEEFEEEYKAACAENGRDQYLANYFIVGHPGTTLERAVELFEKLFERNYSPEQAQEFLPLPMTRGMVQFVAGQDPITLEEVYVPRTMAERKQQKALVRWKDPDNAGIVIRALDEAGRGDLIPAFRQALEREIKRGKAGPGKRKGRGKASRPPESADLDVAG
ncbi:YgiQ family radical SAM protein [Planctomycetes bacterium Pla163]